MGLARRVALAVLVLSFLVFVALFGRIPAFRSTPVGALHRLLLHRIPTALWQLDQRLTGGRLMTSSSRLGHYLLYEKHPIVLIGFITLLSSATTLFLKDAWSLLPTHHHIIIPPLLLLPYWSTYLTATSHASYITPANLARELRRFPYDDTLYHPNTTCSTCRIPKPARSKHCSLCKTCVAKSDHHCAWINNCVGRENYRWFLLLLLSLGILLSYGAYLAWLILSASAAWLAPAADRGIWERFSAALATNLNIGAVGLLAGLTAPLAWGLLGYHVYLVWAGMTTNETGKWGVLGEDIADGEGDVWMRRTVGAVHRDGKLRGQEVVMLRDGRRLPHEDGWREVRGLDELENVYDFGFWTNLADIVNAQ